jgi:predicted ATPase
VTRGPIDEGAVDAAFCRAIQLARDQGALAWELRAATALTRERLRRDASSDALGDLATIYGKFSEGLGMTDLQAARRLLHSELA